MKINRSSNSSVKTKIFFSNVFVFRHSTVSATFNIVTNSNTQSISTIRSEVNSAEMNFVSKQKKFYNTYYQSNREKGRYYQKQKQIQHLFYSRDENRPYPSKKKILVRKTTNFIKFFKFGHQSFFRRMTHVSFLKQTDGC